MADFKVTELAEDLDFDSLPYWDVVIIGAGPAGLAASLTTAHRGLTTLVIDLRNRNLKVSRVGLVEDFVRTDVDIPKGRILDHTHAKNRIAVTLPEPVVKGQVFMVRIDYEGNPRDRRRRRRAPCCSRKAASQRYR